MDKRVWSFLALAFGFTWGVAGIGILGFGLNAASGAGYAIMAAVCMLGPALAALVQQRLFDRAPWSGLGLPLRGTRWVFVGLTACSAWPSYRAPCCPRTCWAASPVWKALAMWPSRPNGC
ncbi:MAG TPA: hypothetical protein PLN54_10665 [Flavobacteriales bacterium]|nr:hypothetical protein [Flavobacteriales bacterium]